MPGWNRRVHRLPPNEMHKLLPCAINLVESHLYGEAETKAEAKAMA
ncbi:hypothetical protein [Evansella halocellulosilytica]|nr:hypothetical protein [Evansella halocellulosilytica]